MRSLLILSAGLLLFLLLSVMPKTLVTEFDNGVNYPQVITSKKALGCFSNRWVSGYKINQIHIPESSSWLDSLTTSHSSIFSSLFYIPQMVAWSRSIGLSYRRPQPYRNPLRRFRLNKKQRRRLRRHLLTLLAQTNNHLSASSMEEV